MSKNWLIKTLLSSVAVLCCFAHKVYADIAPDPIEKAVSVLPLVLIVAVVVVAVVLVIKFFKKS